MFKDVKRFIDNCTKASSDKSFRLFGKKGDLVTDINRNVSSTSKVAYIHEILMRFSHGSN